MSLHRPVNLESAHEREQANHLSFVGLHYRGGGFQILDARQSDFDHVLGPGSVATAAQLLPLGPPSVTYLLLRLVFLRHLRVLD